MSVAFDKAWSLLKAKDDKCPKCGLMKTHCMTMKSGCGSE